MCCVDRFHLPTSSNLNPVTRRLSVFIVLVGIAFHALFHADALAAGLAKNPALFEVGEIKEPPSFIAKLSAEDADPVSRYLWATFDPRLREALKSGDKDSEDKLVAALNNIIQTDYCIYTESRFLHVKLLPETAKLKAHDRKGWDLIWLNRLLLQDAYPTDLTAKTYEPYEQPHVWQVRTQAKASVKSDYPYKAQRNDDVWVDAYGLDSWIDDLKQNKRVREEDSVQTLILYLNHVPVPGTHSFAVFPYADANNIGLTCLGFTLAHNEQSRAAWLHLLNQPVLSRRVAVTVGFENGEEMDSYVDVVDAAENVPRNRQFLLTVIPNRTAFGVAIIVAALFTFLWLARHTHIIRDAAAPRRPDGLRPYSLARTQMAFWFFLVVTSYFFLWIITGDMDTLNTSVLGLIGISAGTALGSAFVDASKPHAVDSPGNVPIVDVTKPHLEVVEELAKLRQETQKELEALQKARAQILASDKQQLDANEREQNKVQERLLSYRWQTAYFAWPSWKGVMYDLLAENNLISFHRFQIFVWTLVLGVMFVTSVYNDLAMPRFSSTLLGLLGISAGTYVGFKLPEPKTA